MGAIAGGGLHEGILKDQAPINMNQLMQGYNAAQDRQRAIAMEQAQQNAIQTETAQRQQVIDENANISAAQSKLQELLQNPGVQAQVAKGDYTAIQGLHPKVAEGAITNLGNMAKTAQTLQADRLTQYAKGRSELKDVLSGLDPKDDATAAAQYNDAVQRLAAEHPELASQLPQASAGNVRDLSKQLAGSNGLASEMLTSALAQQKTKADADKAAADAAEKTAQLPGVTAKAKTDAAVAAATMADPKLLTPEQRQQAADKLAELARQNARDAQLAKSENTRNAIEGQNAAIKAKEFELENGGDAVKGWVQSIYENPDAVSSIPPKLRTAVMQGFQKQYDMPLPKGLTGQALNDERNARDTYAAAQRIEEALKDPDIQGSVGQILGNLGNLEQRFGGNAVRLTPEKEAKAQQLRTDMNYLTFKEGKTLFGGRAPQKLMQELQSTSPRLNMDAGTLTGAIQGVKENAYHVAEGADKTRFGGRARPAEDRGFPKSQPSQPAEQGPPIALLPAGHDVTFKNGQVWRNVNGTAQRIK